MSIRREPIPSIPEETQRVAKAAFPQGNVYMQMRDELGSLYTDDMFSALYAQDGQPAISPWRLALVTVMQFAENLSDRQAADAVRSRIDWKYALSLSLSDEGFDYSVLSEFRSRLVEGEAGQVLLDELLTQCTKRGWLRGRGQQRTDSTHIVSAVRVLNQLEIVGETLRHCLNVLAMVVPEWLQEHVEPVWYERYGGRFDDFRLPKSKSAREQLAQTIGQDGYHLMNAVFGASDLAWLRALPAVQTLRCVWIQQYWHDNGRVQRREPKDMPPSGTWIRSPYDVEVSYGKKREFDWIGYKVHLTETCDDNLPHLITQVETRPAHEQDHHALTHIQAQLAARDLLPTQQLVDAGYISAKRILHSQDVHGIELVGPVHLDPSWQARTSGAFDASQFLIDWANQQVICPLGHPNVEWQLTQDAQGESVVRILFDKHVCLACRARAQCTDAQKSGRAMTLRFPQQRHETLQSARLRQTTPDFKATYALRAGIEGTFSQTTRNTGLRQTRYRGIAKTHLQHLATAVATNLLRLMRWLNGVPFAQTRTSRFAALAPI